MLPLTTPKGNQSWMFFGRTDSKAKAPILWPPIAKSRIMGKDADAGKNWGQEDKQMTQDEWLDGISDSVGMTEQTPGDSEGQGSLAVL